MLQKIFIGIFVVASALLAPATMIPAANALSMPSEVTIEALTCGVSTTLASLNYGSLTNGATSTEQTLHLTGTGNTNGQILISGSDWIDTTAQTTQMFASRTHFDGTPSVAYADKAAAVTSIPTSLPVGTSGSFSIPGADVPLYWQLKADLVNAGFSGQLSQTIDITTQC